MDDLFHLVVWVKQFNGRPHRQSEMIANGLGHMELALAALGTKLTVTEKKVRRHGSDFSTHSCH